jgi:molecular chaperone GrpE
MSKDEKIVHSDEDELDESYSSDEKTSETKFNCDKTASAESEIKSGENGEHNRPDGSKEEQNKKNKKHGSHGEKKEYQNADKQDGAEEIPSALAKELEAAKAASEDYKRKWVAVTAEYENYRKRNQLSVSQAYADGKAEAVKKLLPVSDTFGYAYDGASDEKTKAGIDKIIKNFNSILSSLGIEEIAIKAGDKFDESVAEAIMNIPCKEGEEANCVSQVLKKGYKQGDKVIRFAQVVVTVE